MRLDVPNLPLYLDEIDDPPSHLARRIAKLLGVPLQSVRELEVVRRSLDARGRRPPHWLLMVRVRVDPAPTLVPPGVREVRPRPPRPPVHVRSPEQRPVVVGAGPAGLFCALALVEAGVPCVLIERGRPVEPRKHDVARLYRAGELDLDSNVSFGEGGAGTFTDGKLSTRVKDPEVREVLEALVAHGADPDILVTHKPHLGSERLPAIVAALREHLRAQGCEILFENRVDDLVVRGGRVAGVRLRGGVTVDTDRVILAPGGAARELYRALAAHPGVLQAKPLALGLRVEHPQGQIDAIQYGRAAGHPMLPPADYKLAGAGGDGRGVWAFCMCPGGVVVPTPTEPGLLCVNGMSNSRRSSPWANSALVVHVDPTDFARAGAGDDVLAGMRFQEAVEARAYQLGGGGYRAPAQRVTDFLRGREGELTRRSSYPRGLTAVDLGPLFPDWITRALREAVGGFDRRMRGFVTDEAILVGAETRTSAPVTFPRRADLVSPALPGLYPCGEGCGHAGGIVSAAIDGLRVARRILAELQGG